MKATFVLGRAGSGKTTRCLREIRDELVARPAGAPLLLLAPKQATYQLERQLLAMEGLDGFSRLHVLSFERLARLILDAVGVTPPPVLDEVGRVMLLRSLLQRHGGELKVLGGAGRLTGLAQELSQTLAELGHARIGPAQLRELAGTPDTQLVLAAKLADLALLSERLRERFESQGVVEAGSIFERAIEVLGAMAMGGNEVEARIALRDLAEAQRAQSGEGEGGRTTDGGRRTADGGQLTEGGGRKTDDGVDQGGGPLTRPAGTLSPLAGGEGKHSADIHSADTHSADPHSADPHSADIGALSFLAAGEGGGAKADDGQRTAEGRRRTEAGGRRAEEQEAETTGGGQRSSDGGRALEALFAGLWLDGFARLTWQEHELLRALARVTERMTLAFCVERLPSPGLPWHSMWAPVGKTLLACMRSLEAMGGVEVAVETLGREAGLRFRRQPVLGWIEARWGEGRKPAATADDGRRTAEDGGRKTEDGRRRTEDRGQRTDVGGRTAGAGEDGGGGPLTRPAGTLSPLAEGEGKHSADTHSADIGTASSLARGEGRPATTEDGGRRTENGGRTAGAGEDGGGGPLTRPAGTLSPLAEGEGKHSADIHSADIGTLSSLAGGEGKGEGASNPQRAEQPGETPSPSGAPSSVLRPLASSFWPLPFDLRSPASGLRLVACANVEGEAVCAAREILRFVRDRGGRFREAAVLLRSLEGYADVLRRVFARYDIPCFIDRRESVTHHPAAEALRYALRVAAGGWGHEDWFGLLKTGLITSDEDAVDRLENLALERGLRSAFWRGAGGEKEADLPSWVCRARDAWCPAVERFCVALEPEVGAEGPRGRQLTAALRELWRALEVEQTLERWADTEGHEVDLVDGRMAAVHRGVAEQVAGLWQDIDLALGEDAMSLAEWLTVIEAGLAGLTVGVVPPALDQVVVGTVDRSRNPELKLALVLGANEGVFPAAPGKARLLTEAESDVLAARGLEFGMGRLERIALERYLGYIAMTRATDRLVVTFSQQDVRGVRLQASVLVTQLRRLLPELEVSEEATLGAWDEIEHSVELERWVVGGGETTDDRGPRTADGGRLADDGGWWAEDGGGATADGRPPTADDGQRTGDGRRTSGDGGDGGGCPLTRPAGTLSPLAGGEGKYSADTHSADTHSADIHSADTHSADIHSADIHSADIHSADIHSADIGTLSPLAEGDGKGEVVRGPQRAPQLGEPPGPAGALIPGPTPLTSNLRPLTSGLWPLASGGHLAALRARAVALRAALGQERLSGEVVQALFGVELVTSVGALEDFAACPFRYFVGRTLRARERPEFDPDARDHGEFLHKILGRFHERVAGSGRRWRDVPPDEGVLLVREIGAEVLAEIRHGVLKQSARSRAAMESAAESLSGLVRQLLVWASQYEFEPRAVEVEFGEGCCRPLTADRRPLREDERPTTDDGRRTMDGGWRRTEDGGRSVTRGGPEFGGGDSGREPDLDPVGPSPWPLPFDKLRGEGHQMGRGEATCFALGDGRWVRVRGRIDRVDVMADPAGGLPWGVVVDYKTRRRTFDEVAFEAGLELQLAVYLRIVCGGGVAEVGPLRPAGMFFVGLSGGSRTTKERERDGLAAAEAAAALDAWQHRGRFDGGLLRWFDRREVEVGDQFAYRLKKDGGIDSRCRDVLDGAGLVAMLTTVERLVVRMGQAIFAGEIGVDPWRKGTETACDRCDFRSICRFDPLGRGYRALRSPSGSGEGEG